MKDKMLYLEDIIITATKSGIKGLEKASSAEQIRGDFELAFKGSEGGI